jgi:hypothetical protein
MKNVSKRMKVVLGGLLILFLLIQFVPYGRNHSNPPVKREPLWDSPPTRALAQTGCFDCHSNETVWPWYSHVAPVSWLVQHDVDEGRQKLNFSDWGADRKGEELDELLEVIRKGEMPLKVYLVTHPEARFTSLQREQLADGFLAMNNGNYSSGKKEKIEEKEEGKEQEYDE